jgi:hypothetical protein
VLALVERIEVEWNISAVSPESRSDLAAAQAAAKGIAAYRRMIR